MIQKRGIALLVTVFFIMLVTISVGVGLKYIKEGNNSIHEEQFLFQSAMVLDDVLHMLTTSSELEGIGSAIDMSNFLLSSEMIPFESNGLEVIIKFSSARSKINPNALQKKVSLDAFKNFLMTRGINTIYADFLFDSMSRIREDQTYTTEIFNKNPEMFRDYIASQKHLEAINEFYVNTLHDSNFKSLETQEFLYLSSDTNSSVDLNFATAQTYEILLGCDVSRAEVLSLEESVRENIEDLQLSDEEKINLTKFQTSFFEPYLDVNIEIRQKDKTSKIRFEYNIKSKKGSHFVFEV
ncbi:hypothetical protein N9X61_00665 [Sulfurimonas sp.]|nr:hypothetical protein [Sulfurimonas sp.]